MVRAITDERSTATLLSVDGIGAFDYVSRSAMLGKLRTVPRGKRDATFALHVVGTALAVRVAG